MGDRDRGRCRAGCGGVVAVVTVTDADIELRTVGRQLLVYVEIELRVIGPWLVAYVDGEPIEYRDGTTELDAMLLRRATRKRVRRMLRGNAGEIARADATRRRIEAMTQG